MSERETLPPDIHPEVTLLPWFASGTLKEPERQQVAQHLESCVSCRQELNEITAMKLDLGDAYRTSPQPSIELSRSVMRQVAQEAARHRTSSATQSSPLSGLDQWLRSLLQLPWIPTLAALALAVQFSLLLWVTQPPAPSDHITSRSIASPTARIRVTFHESATEGQIRGLLDSLHARINDGPDSDHTYVLRIDAADATVTQTVLDTLRGRTDIVINAGVLSP
ncbi:MAG: zf-HC2 domain-containing protein [Nitrospira sp.]|nr:zf-HC2 domain-containing protein [Nitrospira sp.]